MLRICPGACKIQSGVCLSCRCHLMSSIFSATCRPALQSLPCGSNGDQLACCLQGLTLNEPEVVPFRLTQNMIDAFGVAGVEGVFRKTCEVSLEVSSMPCRGAPPCSPCFPGSALKEKGEL